MSSFWFRWLFAKGLKNTDIEKCTLRPLPKTVRADIQPSFIRGVGTTGYNFSCQCLKVWPDLIIITYILKKGCEQVSHFVMPCMDKSAFHARHCRINVESLATRTCRWEILRCLAIQAEHIVELTFVYLGRSSLTLMRMSLTNSRYSSSLPGHLSKVVLGSPSHGAVERWCYSVPVLSWQSFSLRSLSTVACSRVRCCFILPDIVQM